MKITTFLLISLWFIGTSCGHKKPDHVTVNYQLKGDTIVIPDSSNIKPKLKVAKAFLEPYKLQIFSAAKITAIPTKYAVISAPFSGRIVQSFVNLGQNVAQGTPLFSIISSDFTDAQKLYLQAAQQFQLAEKDFKRQRDLLDNGVGIQKDLESAKTTYEITKSEYEKAQASIRIFGVDPAKMIFGEPLIVRAPFRAEVISNKIVVGKYLTDNSDPILTIAELSTVWITATVKEKDIRFISEGDVSDAEVTAYPGETFIGKVYHIDNIVDEETRAINVLIECPNKGGKLKPGMYATIKFTEKPVEAVFLPSSALLQLNDQNFVFREVKPGKFLKVFVKTGETVKGKTLITDGLQGNENVIVEGGFYLLDAK
jgi:cobalt-zinc-cadmium efflux system membrane fusion protein